MDDENDRNLGLSGARTPLGNSGAAIEADQGRAAKVGAVTAMAEAALGDLARQLASGEDEAEQASLMLDEMDEQFCLFGGPVKHVADKIDAHRRGPGRPKGSQNKASREFGEVLQRMGYRHPGLNLAAMANADPAALAIELGLLPVAPDGEEPHEWLSKIVLAGAVKRSDVIDLMIKAMDMIAKANAELLPYFESKAPTKLDVDKRVRLGVMVIGDMAVADGIERKTLDLTKFDAPT